MKIVYIYHGCAAYTNISFIVEVLHLITLYKVFNKFFDELLQMLHKVLSIDKTIPMPYYEANKFISNLGLYKIHTCVYACILFWKEYNNNIDVCPICDQSRWILPRCGVKVRDVNEIQNISKRGYQ